MACGVTKNGIVCDNAGTSARAGQHSGLTKLWGFDFRVRWSGSDMVTAVMKRPIMGAKPRTEAGIVDPAAPALPMTAIGMDMSARLTLTTGWQRPSTWAARSGFSNVEIDNASLVVAGSGNVRVHVRGDATIVTYDTVSSRLVKNGLVLATFATVEQDNTFDTAVVDGDKLWVEFKSTYPYGTSFGTSYIEANTGTYIYTQVL